MLASQNRHADKIKKKREKSSSCSLRQILTFLREPSGCFMLIQTEVQTEIQIEFKLNSIQIQ